MRCTKGGKPIFLSVLFNCLYRPYPGGQGFKFVSSASRLLCRICVCVVAEAEDYCDGDGARRVPGDIFCPALGGRVICLAPSKDFQTFSQLPAGEGRGCKTLRRETPQSKADAERWDWVEWAGTSARNGRFGESSSVLFTIPLA